MAGATPASLRRRFAGTSAATFRSPSASATPARLRRRFAGPILLHLPAQKGHALAQLLHAVNAVFDADPAVEADSRQRAENGVVVVQALADRAMPQPAGIADAVFLAA